MLCNTWVEVQIIFCGRVYQFSCQIAFARCIIQCCDKVHNCKNKVKGAMERGKRIILGIVVHSCKDLLPPKRPNHGHFDKHKYNISYLFCCITKKIMKWYNIMMVFGNYHWCFHLCSKVIYDSTKGLWLTFFGHGEQLVVAAKNFWRIWLAKTFHKIMKSKFHVT